MSEPGTSLANLEQAERLLARVASVDDAKGLIDLAEAARVYARQVKLGTGSINHATEVKVRAELRLAELVDEGQARGAIAKAEAGRPVSTRSAGTYAPATLPELGLSSQRVAEARTLRDAYSDADVREIVTKATEDDVEVTRAELLRAAKRPHVAHNSGENEWYTPTPYVEAVREVLGGIDLDPASSDAANAVVRADLFFTAEQDGLTQPWRGRVFMNPPYAQPLISRFCEKLGNEFGFGNVREAVALVNNGTETGWFQGLAANAAAIAFPSGRVKFWAPDRSTAAPLQGQALLYLGTRPAAFANRFEDFGLVSYVGQGR